jgi:hypothetical protein
LCIETVDDSHFMSFDKFKAIFREGVCDENLIRLSI